MNIYGYIRVSTREQNEDRLGITHCTFLKWAAESDAEKSRG